LCHFGIGAGVTLGDVGINCLFVEFMEAVNDVEVLGWGICCRIGKAFNPENYNVVAMP
jgi:hypothetical protein